LACPPSDDESAYQDPRLLWPSSWKDFENIITGKIGEKLSILTQNAAIYAQKTILALVFKKNANFSLKIGENRRKW
jgi:hypothetical protein